MSKLPSVPRGRPTGPERPSRSEAYALATCTATAADSSWRSTDCPFVSRPSPAPRGPANPARAQGTRRSRYSSMSSAARVRGDELSLLTRARLLPTGRGCNEKFSRGCHGVVTFIRISTPFVAQTFASLIHRAMCNPHRSPDERECAARRFTPDVGKLPPEKTVHRNETTFPHPLIGSSHPRSRLSPLH